jgi:hypothetical protein
MVTIGGCASFLRSLGVSQILVFRLRALQSAQLTLDYRKVNSVVQVDAARIPDVKETVQSLRVLAGESQRQVNARRDGTRKSIHDHDAAAS